MDGQFVDGKFIVLDQGPKNGVLVKGQGINGILGGGIEWGKDKEPWQVAKPTEVQVCPFVDKRLIDCPSLMVMSLCAVSLPS